MDGKLDHSSEKIKIKQEKICYFEDYCSRNACDQIINKEGLIKPEYDLTDEWEMRDNVETDYFKFVTPEDVKQEDTDESSTIESTSDPINIEEGTFVCEYCKRAFTTPEYCKKHTRKCRNKMYDQPSTSSTVLEKKPRLSRDKEELYQCDYCDYKFKSRSGLDTHTRKHSGVGLLTCIKCNKQFAKPSLLARHMLIHTKEEPHKCTHCKAAFNQASNLKTHMMTHSGIRTHKCTQCGKSFTQSVHLKTHMRTHTAEKPYKCTQCVKSFGDLSALIRHMRTHTAEKPYKCTQCSKCFTDSGNLTKHARAHTGEKPYKCTVCNRTFTRNTTLKAHMNRHSSVTGSKL